MTVLPGVWVEGGEAQAEGWESTTIGVGWVVGTERKPQESVDSCGRTNLCFWDTPPNRNVILGLLEGEIKGTKKREIEPVPSCGSFLRHQ